MKKGSTILVICCIYSLLPICSYAQESVVQDSLWQQRQIVFAKDLSAQQFSGPNSPVYKGCEYLPSVVPANGNAFFDTDGWQDGSVSFKGMLYSHLPLKYDIQKDELVLQSWNKMSGILLAQENVQWFTIGSNYFIFILSADSLGNSPPATGYYEELVYGKVTLLAKRIKTIIVPTSTSTTRSFTERDQYFIKKDDKYYRVRTKHSVLEVLADHKKEIDSYLRKNNINFGLNREMAMIDMVKYENMLNVNQR